MPKIGGGNYFPTHLFENTHAVVVGIIPKYIDGFKKYLEQTNNYVNDTHDGLNLLQSLPSPGRPHVYLSIYTSSCHSYQSLHINIVYYM